MPTPFEVDRELNELHDLLHARAHREPPEHFLSKASDRLPALRMRIDAKVASLGTGQEDECLGEEEFLGLIADLVEYRIALFDSPIAFYPSDEEYVLGEQPAYVVKVQASREGAALPITKGIEK